jgi:hypothetical protein
MRRDGVIRSIDADFVEQQASQHAERRHALSEIIEAHGLAGCGTRRGSARGRQVDSDEGLRASTVNRCG